MVDALPVPTSDKVDNKTFSQLAAAKAAASIAPRDPHELPDFSPLVPLTTPILYLPPLLSSLPEGLSHIPNPSPDNPPLTSDTRLPNIDPVSLSLHKALHHFKPLDSTYATTNYIEAFNWSELQLPVDEEREWYCVAFRSKRRSGSDSGRKCHDIFILNSILIIFQLFTKLIYLPMKRPFRAEECV